MTSQIPVENAAGFFATATFSYSSADKRSIYPLWHIEPSQEHPHITIHRQRFRLQYRLKRTDISWPSSCSVLHCCRTSHTRAVRICDCGWTLWYISSFCACALKSNNSFFAYTPPDWAIWWPALMYLPDHKNRSVTLYNCYKHTYMYKEEIKFHPKTGHEGPERRSNRFKLSRCERGISVADSINGCLTFRHRASCI